MTVFQNQNFMATFYIIKLVRRNDFSRPLRKIIIRYKHIGNNLNGMQKYAYIVFNLIMVDKYTSIFNCPTMDHTSVSMMARLLDSCVRSLVSFSWLTRVQLFSTPLETYILLTIPMRYFCCGSIFSIFWR